MKSLLLLAPILAIPLSGCVSFGAKPPAALMALSSDAQMPVGTSQKSNSEATITISVPTLPQELSSSRVPVRSGGTAIAYVKDAQWVERPSQLFTRLLGDTVTARTGRLVLSARQSQLDPGAYLSGDLRNFGVDADSKEAVVTYDASLNRGDANVFEKRRFEARVPISEVDATQVRIALNRAANQVAAEVADWVGR